MSNCFPGAANLAASGSPTDILHPLPRPRRDLLLAHAYQHLQLAYASLPAAAAWCPSTLDRITDSHIIPAPQPLLRVLPSSLAHRIPTPSDFPNPGKEPVELLLAPWVSVGAGPGRERTSAGLRSLGAASPSARKTRELLHLFVVAFLPCSLNRLVSDLR